MKILKKIFIISSILLLFLLVFFGIYTIAFKKETVQKVQRDDTDGFDIENLMSEKMTNITSDSVISATIGPDGETVRYYDALDGRVWTMTLRGTNKEVLSGETRGVPENVKWSADGASAILTHADGTISVYNHATNVSSDLRSGMDDVVWAGVSGKIIYKYYDEASKERSLNIANADGSNWKKLADLPYRYTDFVQIPSSILAAFWPRAGSENASELFTVSTINAGEPKKIYSAVRGTDYLFSPDGKNILVSSPSADGSTITLGVMGASGQEYTDLMIPTLVSKAVWSRDGKSVYYALPNDVPDNTMWPTDYTEKKFYSQDTFFKLDVETGKKTRIIELDEIKESVDATGLFLSPAEEYLFFINRENDLLYRLNL
jgi:Tol biopolymer transport system component